MKITLGAGNETTTSSVGYNFAYISGEGDIKVVLMNNDSVVIEESVLKVGQDLVGAPERFEKVRITNLHDNEQTIEFSTGSMRLVDTNNGSTVTVASASDVDIATMPNVVVSSTPDNPQKYFCNESAVSHLYSGVAINTFVTPASNTSGVVIYQAFMAVGGIGGGSIVFATSAPAHWQDGNIIQSGMVSSSGYTIMPSCAFPLFVPSGHGIYSHTSSPSYKASLLIEVL